MGFYNMRMYPKCVSCLHNQCLNEIKLATDDKILQKKAIDEIDKILDNHRTSDYVSAMVGTMVHKKVYEITKNLDPYKDLKYRSNEHAQKLLSELEQELDSNNNLLLGLNMAAVGNIMEFGVPDHKFDISGFKNNFLKSLKDPFAIDHRKNILNKLNKSKKILYLTDNAGEIVFDKFFIEQILKENKEVVVATKEEPIANDATLSDAEQIKLDEITKVITTGVASIGLDPNNSSKYFWNELKNSDLIISKGMGNFEWLEEYIDNYNIPVAFLFRTKCNIMANKLDVKKDQNIALLWNSN